MTIRRSLARFCLLPVLFFLLHGQEMDTVLRPNTDSRFTALDEVDEPAEKTDFLALSAEKDPTRRYALAQDFLKSHPRSWLLAAVLEAASKASMDLGEYTRAIAEAKFSLRLFPENPLLLVPLADVEARQGDGVNATAHAIDAIEYLGRFGPPAGMSSDAWPKWKADLNATANFVLGRVYAREAFRKNAAGRQEMLHKAEAVLTTAAGWNSQDAEIFYLRGVVRNANGDWKKATADFATAGQAGSALREQSIQMLRQIYDAHVKGEGSFDDFLKNIPRQAAAPTLLETSAQPVGHYAGSEACKQCHLREYESWQKTGMSRMLRPYDGQNLLGDFRTSVVLRDAAGNPLARVGKDSQPFFEIRAADNTWHKYPVDYTIGSKWQQAYATRLADGRLQVAPVQYSGIRKEWVNYWKMIDPPGSQRSDVRRFPDLLPETNYQSNCAMCHTSQLRAGLSGDNDGFLHAQFQEPGINCEMCHGPSLEHAERMRKQDRTPSTTGGLNPPVDFTRVNHREGVRVCGQCHGQSAVREPGPHAELNYSSAGESFVLPTVSRAYPQFLRRAFYKDGRFRETTFIVEAFTRSACYRKGNAQCASCHDPHPVDAASNPVSLKFRNDPDQMCLQCHEKIRAKLEAHTRHPAASPASRCTACHMPRIMNSLLFQAASHQIDDLPNAEMTARFGQKDSPNACLICHTGKDAAWVASRR